MRYFVSLTVAFSILGCGGPPGVKTKEDALATIKAKGGKIEYEGSGDAKTIVVLNLNKPEFADEGPACAAAFPELSRLWLNKSGVTDSGLSNIQNLTKLRKLGLDDNAISDKGLANLEKLTGLEWLGLSGTQVKGPGFAHLKGMTSLTGMDLRKTPIDDAGLEPLKTLTQMERLMLDGTKVTAGGVKSLSNALPRCRITSDVAKTEGLPGYYEVQNTTIDGKPDGGTKGSYLILRANGTFTIIRKLQIGTQPSGKWDAKGDGKLTMNYSSGTAIVADMEIDGKQLTLSYTDLESKFVMRHERKELRDEPVEYRGGISITK